MGSKAQISAEFFIFLGLAFLVAIAFEIASLEQLSDFRLRKENDIAKDLALSIQKELILAATVEDGYVRTFKLPDQVESINYSIQMQNSTLAVQTKNSYYLVGIPNSIGNLTKGTNQIKKINGILYINGTG